jgi:5-methyltetrahydrofolate--homocysteine methyltransferase
MWRNGVDAIADLRERVITGDAPGTQTLVRVTVAAGMPPEQILREGLISAMTEVGRLFEAGEYYVPEMLVAARAMKGGLELLKPSLAAANVSAIGKIVIGTVQGDLHDIGKNLVAMMMEGAGFEVVDLGVDVPASKFVEAVRQHRPNLLGLSALLTTTMPRMRSTIEALREAGLRDSVQVMIGGAPATLEWATAIGADIYAPDASSAATRATQVVA